MVRTIIQLKEEQMAQLKRLSLKEHRSMADLIRQGVDIIVHSKVMIDTEERKSRAIKACGCFHSGKSDLSTNHDKYLDEAYEK